MSKSIEIYGPLEASWNVRYPDSGGSSQYPTFQRALADVAYFARQGRRDPIVVRTEICPATGCDGEGSRSVKKRGRMFNSDVPCKGCRGRFDTEERGEDLEIPSDHGKSLADVLAMIGLAYRIEYRHGLPVGVITQNGWEMFRGSAGSVWEWLRETGRIL